MADTALGEKILCGAQRVMADHAGFLAVDRA
jgi:hypothetical protein